MEIKYHEGIARQIKRYHIESTLHNALLTNRNYEFQYFNFYFKYAVCCSDLLCNRQITLLAKII